MRRLLSAALALLVAAAAHAQEPITLDPPFGSGMVLPRDREVTLRGTAGPGVRVDLRFRSEEESVRADTEGRFAVKFRCGGMTPEPQQLVVTAGESTLQLDDLLVGDVWLCAGQSNMAWPLSKAATAKEALTRADRPDIRLLHLRERATGAGRRYAPELLADLDASNLFEADGWQPSTPETAATFSAIGWFFAERVTENVRIPTGLIQCAVGGAPIEAFLPRATMLADERLAPLCEDWLDNDDYPGWCRQRARLNLSAWFDDPKGPLPHHPFEPSFLYEAGIAPLADFPIRGVLWYQGESNASYGASGGAVPIPVNRHKLVTFIEALRAQFEAPDLPFLFVQLPGLNRPWVPFRAMQDQVNRTVKNTSMAVTLDVGHPTDVHPRKKQPVGERLARLALRETYGRNVAAYSPEPEWVEWKDEVRIAFRHAEDGLSTTDGEPPRGFEFVTADGTVVPATARIEGRFVYLAAPPPKKGSKVRYAWTRNPDVNLIDSEGLPVGPFRR